MHIKQEKRTSIISVIGIPNAGKSSLINKIVGQKLSIVTNKPQTTRNNIKAIFTNGNTQLVFIDTPGVFIPKKKKFLERLILKNAWKGIREADSVCLLIDAKKGLDNNSKEIIQNLKEHNIVPVIAINKVDLVKKTITLPLIQELKSYQLEEIFIISALKNIKVDLIKNYFLSKAKVGSWSFDQDEITDAPMKFLACEITREKLFLNLNEELPYSIEVKNEAFVFQKDGSIKIYQNIYSLKESQKAIIIGKNGSMLKSIGKEARQEIEKNFDKKVHLFLKVKVKKNWIDEKFNNPLSFS